MDPRGPEAVADVEVAARDARIAEAKRAQQRLSHLSEISKLLLRFDDLERSAPPVMALVTETLPLRNVFFILETASTPTTITWCAKGESEEHLRVARAQAQEAYRYLVGSGVDLGRAGAKTIELPRPAVGAAEAETGARRTFVILPFVVGRGSIFGALQVEGAQVLDEPDLVFINAVVNQLAIALDRHATDQAVRTSEERLAGIVALAVEAIISVDETQHIVMYNPGAENIFGWSRDEALGRPLDMLLPARERQAHGSDGLDFTVGAETEPSMARRALEIRGVRKNGEEFPAEAAISKLKVSGAWLFTVILRDITEQRRVEHEQRFLARLGEVLARSLDFPQTLATVAQLALEELADFCLIDFVDEHGEVRRLEAKTSDPTKADVAEALKQLPLERGCSHPASAVLHSRQPVLIAETTAETLRAWAQSEQHGRLLEAMAPTSMMAVPFLVRGQLLGALTLVSCRAGRRYGTSDLRLLVEVGRRAALALENARLYSAAQRALEARDAVLGVVAHDLRTPLSTILMRVDGLRPPLRQPERRSVQPADAIYRAATRMDRLIQDLLDVTRMEAGALSIARAPVLAEQVIRDALETQAPLATSRSVELRCDVDAQLPRVWADRDRLLQVFENLVGNALKFTSPGGRVTVGARSNAVEVLFWVSDTGPGIATDDLPHLFDRFWQMRAGDRRGAGLGLPIAKGIVEAHGGRIWAESAPGHGSTFYVTVPVMPSAQARRTDALRA